MNEQQTPDNMDEIEAALASGRKIEAIKLYRESTGTGLAEARDAIESLLPKLRERHPERFAALATKESGCASVLVCFVGASVCGMAWLIRLWG